MTVEVLNESGTAVDEAGLLELARFVLGRLRIHPQADLSVLLVDEGAMERLHVQWMDEPGPTDVLSFPMDELSPGRRDREPEDEPEGYLGDIALCPQVAAQQAPAAGHDVSDEIDLLTTHGILHLLGFDHATPEEHAEMFGIQGRLLLEWQQVAAGGDVEDGVVEPRPGADGGSLR